MPEEHGMGRDRSPFLVMFCFPNSTAGSLVSSVGARVRQMRERAKKVEPVCGRSAMGETESKKRLENG